MSTVLKQPLTDEQITAQYGEQALQALNKDSLMSAEQAAADETARNCKGFQSGDAWTGNRNGRPKGSLSKIQAMFYDHLYKDWCVNGEAAIEAMRIDSPKAYVQVVASILPKALEVDVSDGTRWVINASPGLSSSEWLAMHKLTQPIDAQVIEYTQDTGEDTNES